MNCLIIDGVGLSETRNGPSPFSFTFNDNLRNVDVSDENKQRLAQVKDDMKNDFDRKLKKLTTGANAGIDIERFHFKF